MHPKPKDSLQFVIVCYDVRVPKRLNRLRKLLEAYGDRVQKSIFECLLSPKNLEAMKRGADEIIEQEDSLRIYALCHGCRKNIEATDCEPNIQESAAHVV